MKFQSRLHGALSAAAFAVAAIPLTALASPAVGHAQEDCTYNYFWNTATNQCEFCDTPIMYWNAETNQCLAAVTPNPVLGPVGPVGVGPDPVVGPAGPVGVGGLGPVAGPVGPVGVGGVGPVVGPVGPIGIGPR